jgi:hypothetical protein
MATRNRPGSEKASTSNHWTQADTSRAIEIWAEYQRRHDVSAMFGQTVGIDPASGRVWIGEAATDIWKQQEAEGIDVPLYYVRIGSDYYVRKGGRK